MSFIIKSSFIRVKLKECPNAIFVIIYSTLKMIVSLSLFIKPEVEILIQRHLDTLNISKTDLELNVHT